MDITAHTIFIAYGTLISVGGLLALAHEVWWEKKYNKRQHSWQQTKR